jgi:beta-lactamase superfamily II metal-dependent hydrolase
MAAVRGEMSWSKRGLRADVAACREPQRAQNVSDGATSFPQLVQNGILLIVTLREPCLFTQARGRMPSMRNLILILALAGVLPAARAAKTLDIYFVDVEGGQATLIVTPSKQSMLVDAGWPGFTGRDADRIRAAAKAADIKHIDYLVVTHYHTDHVGGVLQLAERIPVKTFVDHGPNNETGKNAEELNSTYQKAVAAGKHMIVKPGDKIPLKGVDVTVLTANGERIASPVAGGGQANALCGKDFPEDKTENARSVGTLITFGKFRMINLGDLTSRKEAELVCPENRVGPVDLYLTTHHGTNTSNAEVIVHALKPRVAIMNNGARKGGSPDSWQIIRKSPGLEDLWQLHFAVAGGKENNVPDSFIANLDPGCEGKHIKVSANTDGSFTVLNTRNKYEKSYKAK